MRFVFVFIVLAFIGSAFVSGYFYGKTTLLPMKTTPTPTPKLTSYDIYDLVNEYRINNDLKPLRFNQEMCEYASKRARDIQSKWSHDEFNKLKNPYKQNEYSNGENLARGISEGKQLLKAWLESPTHKKNIVDATFTDTCIAVDGLYAVQEFASF